MANCFSPYENFQLFFCFAQFKSIKSKKDSEYEISLFDAYVLKSISKKKKKNFKRWFEHVAWIYLPCAHHIWYFEIMHSKTITKCVVMNRVSLLLIVNCSGLWMQTLILLDFLLQFNCFPCNNNTNIRILLAHFLP